MLVLWRNPIACALGRHHKSRNPTHHSRPGMPTWTWLLTIPLSSTQEVNLHPGEPSWTYHASSRGTSLGKSTLSFRNRERPRLRASDDPQLHHEMLLRRRSGSHDSSNAYQLELSTRVAPNLNCRKCHHVIFSLISTYTQWHATFLASRTWCYVSQKL